MFFKDRQTAPWSNGCYSVDQDHSTNKQTGETTGATIVAMGSREYMVGWLRLGRRVDMKTVDKTER